MDEPFQRPHVKTERAFVGPVFYMIAGSIVATLIYAELHHEEIKKSLKPTFTVSTPWGTAEILTPWGENKPTSPHIYTRGQAPQPPSPPATPHLNGVDAPRVKEFLSTESKTIFKCIDAHGTTFQNMPCDQSR